MKRTAVLLFLISALRASAGAGAPVPAATPARPDPLASLVAEALRNNLALNGERLAERRSASERTAARARFLPTVHLESRASHLHDTQDLGNLINPAYAALNELSGRSTFPTGVSLTLPARNESHVRVIQPLLNEALRANVALMGARHSGQDFAFRAAARRLAAAVQTAYLQEAATQRLVNIYAATLELVQENERVAERLLAAGRVTPEAVLRARADRSEIEQQLADGREKATAAARELNRIVGRPLEQTVEVIPDSLFDLPLDIDADEAVLSALAQREELAQSDAGVQAAEAAKRITTASLLPSVSGVFDLSWQGHDYSFDRDNRSWVASLVASWDLFPVHDMAQRSAAGYEVERARNARRDAAEQITVEVRNAHEAARVARAAIATAAARVEAARRTFTLVRRRYEEGSASPVELVDARTSLTNSESNQVVTLYRYAIRRVDLERAAALRNLPLVEGDLR